jgi:hypothetical protein
MDGTKSGGGVMRRKKRFAIGWVALGLAVVAMVPVTAEAKPLPTDTSHEQGMPVYVTGTMSPDDRAFSRVETGTLSPDDRAFSRIDSARQVETPYVSHGVGVTPDDRAFSRVDSGTLSPDDRAFSRVDSARQVETPYVSHGVGVTPDDRGFARVGPETTTIVATDDGSRFDVNPYLVSGFGLALLLLAGGMGIAIRQSRKTTLSPA